MKTLYDIIEPDGERKARAAGRCSYVTAAQVQCYLDAVGGSTYCILHGGASTFAESDAIKMIGQQLIVLGVAAVSLLREALLFGDDKQARIAFGLLDRIGFGPQSKVTVDESRRDLSMLNYAELVHELEVLTSQAREEANKRMDGTLDMMPVAGRRTH